MEFTLEPASAAYLAPYTPGAHVTVQTPSGAMRRYSLVGSGEATNRYVIAVKKETSSRGGSQSMHANALEGYEIPVLQPENSFPLKPASKYLLIAGGIGVTPIYSMALRLAQDGRDFQIIYCTRNPVETAYRDEMREAFGDRLVLHHDDGDSQNAYDFWPHLEKPQNMGIYCCGPKLLMNDIRAMSDHWPDGRINFEDFKPFEVTLSDDRPFEVELAKSGKTVLVPADRSILEALRENGVPTASSCESGTCGTCKTGLISGEVEHRDLVLMEEEQDRHIMICVSRARGSRLVLDL
ncbi:PDR/VanB family oxidoreductase [Pseudorhodoplanes sp.]|uniref:PDR/VanB family oxidoreductase n=1 Tax=Pseudorhodoplanes sp. TaxID=1934341 RepID=UPI003D136543